MVENIKKDAELKKVKSYQKATFVTNLVFLFSFLTQDIFGVISTPVLVVMLIGGISNILAMTYFENKVQGLSK